MVKFFSITSDQQQCIISSCAEHQHSDEECSVRVTRRMPLPREDETGEHRERAQVRAARQQEDVVLRAERNVPDRGDRPGPGQILSLYPRLQPVPVEQAVEAGRQDLRDTRNRLRVEDAVAQHAQALGKRGVGLARAQGYGPGFGAYREWLGAGGAVVMVMIEHIDAVRNLREILAVPGVDGYFIGPYDLSSSMGLAGQLEHPDVVAAIAEIRSTAKAMGKPGGVHVIEGGIFVPPVPLSDLMVAADDAAPGRPPVPDAVYSGALSLDDLGLTPRQTDVLHLLLQGLTNTLIANELGISAETVKLHVSAILRSYGVAPFVSTPVTPERIFRALNPNEELA